MSILKYYIIANVFLLLCCSVYMSTLKKNKNFAYSRFFLTLSILFSLIVPFMFDGLVHSLETLFSGEVIKPGTLPNVNFIIQYIEADSFIQKSGLTLNPQLLLILCGVLISTTILIYQYIKIRDLLDRSEEALPRNGSFRLFRSPDIRVPFVFYNRIFIPSELNRDDTSMALRHERHHLGLKHHWDLFLYSLSQVVFYLNPAYYFLRSELKMVHEYQVDKKMICQDLDATAYMLSLIKFSAGHQKFALATAFSGSNLKKRINMINHNSYQKPKKNIFISLGLLLISSLLISISCIDNNTDSSSVLLQDEIKNSDTIIVQFIEADADIIKQQDNQYVLSVLMNRWSTLLIEGEKANLNNAEDKILISYRTIESFIGENSPGDKSATSVYFQHDVGTSAEDIATMEAIFANCFKKLREDYATKNFGKNFSELSEQEKLLVKELIPAKVFIGPNKDMAKRATK